MSRQPILRALSAELIGTFILVLLGSGAGHVAILTGAVGLWPVALSWGLAAALAIYATSAASGAHLNPAITVALAVHQGFPWRRVPMYALAQTLGAFLAAAVLYALFAQTIAAFELQHGLIRGQPGSELSGMIYSECFPNPAIALEHHWNPDVISVWQAMFAEALGTAVLAFAVSALADPGNPAAPGRRLAPLMVAIAVAVIITVIAPLTQCGINPARDFGSRLFGWCAGWGATAIPGPRGGFLTIYVLSPILGAVAGAGIHRWFIARRAPPAEPQSPEASPRK